MSTATATCRGYGHYTWRGTWRNVQSDIQRQLTMSPQLGALKATFRRKVGAFLRPELQSLFLYRVSHYLFVNGWGDLAPLISRLNFLLHKVNITPQSCIGPRCRLPHPAGVVFHGRAGSDLTMFSLAVCCAMDGGLEGSVDNGPQVGDRVLVGAHAVLLGPVRIGNDTKIVFAARVDQDVPPGVLVSSRVVRLTYYGPAPAEPSWGGAAAAPGQGTELGR